MILYFGDVISNSRWMGAILISTLDCGYVYLSVLQTACEVKIRKFEGLGSCPCYFSMPGETSVNLTCVGRAIHKGSGIRKILAAYQSCLVETV